MSAPVTETSSPAPASAQEVVGKLTVRLGQMAAEAMVWMEDIHALAEELRACLPPDAPAPDAPAPGVPAPGVPAPGVPALEDETYPWPEALCGELGCLVHDRLLPAFCDLSELASRPHHPGGEPGPGNRPDFQALWRRLRPGPPLAGASTAEAPEPAWRRQILQVAAELGKTLADPQAVEILAHLAGGTLDARELDRITDVPPILTPTLACRVLGRVRALLPLDSRGTGQALALAQNLAELFPPAQIPPALYFDVLSESRALEAQRTLAGGDLPGARRAALHARHLLAGGSGDPLVEAEVLAAEALLAWVEGQPQRTAEHLEEACRLLREAQQPQRLGTLLRALVSHQQDQHRTAEARRLGAELALLARECADPEPAERLLQVLADWRQNQRHQEAAREVH